LKPRHCLAVFAVVPVLIFSLLPLGPMTPDFDRPALATSWIA
jgi:hypothetical protein